MSATLKTLAAFAIAGFMLAGAGTASAGLQIKTPPKLSVKIATPKIVVPKICRNEISRTFVTPDGIRYTAKKCG